MFQANRAFQVQLYSKLNLNQNSEQRHQPENNVLLPNSLFACCYLVSIFMELFSVLTYIYISVLIYLVPKREAQNVEKTLRLSPELLPHPYP